MADILTPRLRLRPATPDDLGSIHAILSHPAAMRFWSTPPHAEVEETRAWLGRMIANAARTGSDFVVEHEGRVIGKAGAYEPPEIGYIFHPDVWGQGFASEALGALIPRLFEINAVSALRADVDPRNLASLRLLERLGFQETGRVRRTWLVGEEWCDSVYLELRRDAAQSWRSDAVS